MFNKEKKRGRQKYKNLNTQEQKEQQPLNNPDS